ncbi:GNAT family N-acetyltransferase [Cohnella sp. GCM10020058]|uniref:GNAT family N-acetyltransferase n=1 Tax=Cohnella sp. GCM10020058 TaxID=3317330 RepID=UPI0036318C58
MRIESLGPGEKPPMALLLLADPSEKLVTQYLRRGVCYVARAEEGDALGTYVLLPTRPDTAELVNVAVDERHQGKGIGKALVLHAIETASREGYRTIEVGTGNSGIGQLALYQKCGFRIVGVDVDFFVRHYEEPIVENGIPCRDMIRMSQDL